MQVLMSRGFSCRRPGSSARPCSKPRNPESRIIAVRTNFCINAGCYRAVYWCYLARHRTTCPLPVKADPREYQWRPGRKPTTTRRQRGDGLRTSAGDGVRRCPLCHRTRTSVVASAKPMPYHCKDCRRYFSVRTGTCIAGSSVSLRAWVHAIHLMSRGVRGTLNFSEALGVHHETVAKLEATIWGAWSASRVHENGRGGAGGTARVQGTATKKPRGRPMRVRDPIPATPREIASAFCVPGKRVRDALRSADHRT